MAATKKAAPANGKATSSAAVQAVAELSNDPRLGVFRGIALTLPPKLPATWALDMASVQAGASAGSNDLGPTYQLFVGVLGVEQWIKVRNKIGEDGQGMDEIGEIFSELLEAITAPYGVTTGESPASAPS